MKLSQWAKKNGLCYKTAWKLAKSGQLPNVSILQTGTILVDESVPVFSGVAIYARVSSHDQKEDLSRQVERLKAFCIKAGLSVQFVQVEVASGLNGNRKKLLRLLCDKSLSAIVVEHKDRLTRFGFDFIESALLSSGRKIIVVEEGECRNDLVQDFVDLATSMCAKIYGQRSAKNRAKRMLEAANEN